MFYKQTLYSLWSPASFGDHNSSSSSPPPPLLLQWEICLLQKRSKINKKTKRNLIQKIIINKNKKACIHSQTPAISLRKRQV
jgi:hypothetical protein